MGSVSSVKLLRSAIDKSCCLAFCKKVGNSGWRSGSPPENVMEMPPFSLNSLSTLSTNVAFRVRISRDAGR